MNDWQIHVTVAITEAFNDLMCFAFLLTGVLLGSMLQKSSSRRKAAEAEGGQDDGR